MDNLKKFYNILNYEMAVLNYPAVSWLQEENKIIFDPAFGGLTVYYYITDTENEVTLFNGRGSSSSSSSESGGGGALPTRMIVDGNNEVVINTWRFDTEGEHIVQYTFENNEIPAEFLRNIDGNLAEITKIEIGIDITAIPDAPEFGGAFSFNGSLTSVTISDSVTSIGSSAFDSCSSLQEVTIPSGVTNIGDGAFSECGGLQSVTILAPTPPTFGAYPFGNPYGPSFPIYVPADSLGAYQNALGDYTSRIQAIPQ